MGKTYIAKTLSGDFKVTTLENLLLSKQAVTSKRISIPYTNLQLNPYLNTQLDLFWSDNLSFQCKAPSIGLINRCADPSMRLNYQLEKDVGCKVLQFIQTKKIKKLLGHKTLRCTNTTASSRERRTRANQVSSHTFLHTCGIVLLCNYASPFTALKIIFIYVQGYEKRKPKHTFTDWIKISSEKLNFININKYLIY